MTRRGPGAGAPGRQETAPAGDSPRVLFPPPLVYLLALALGLAAGGAWPWRIAGSGGWDAALRVAGGALLAGGLALDVVSIAGFVARRTSALPFRPASALVVGGPYRFTRNPMYLGMTLTVAGLGLLLDSWWAVLSAFVAAAAIDRWVVPREERYLARRFGATYLDYASRVRRWL